MNIVKTSINTPGSNKPCSMLSAFDIVSNVSLCSIEKAAASNGQTLPNIG